MSSKKNQDVGRVQRQNSGSSGRDPQEYLPSYEMAIGDPPPTLAAVDKVGAEPRAREPTPDPGEEPVPTTPKMSTTDRWVWAGLVALPLFAAMVLTFLSAASADTWRAELCVLKVSLPEDVWTPLQKAGAAQAAANDFPTNVSLGTIFLEIGSSSMTLAGETVPPGTCPWRRGGGVWKMRTLERELERPSVKSGGGRC
jgi:hypothetical protein